MKNLIFISHSSKEGSVAAGLCKYLEQNGKTCFIAPRDIPYGSRYAEEIVNGIDNSAAMILVLSKNSNQSPHVLREIERAVSKSIPIIIYKLEDVELSKSMEYFLMTHQWMDAKHSGDYSNILKSIDDILRNEEPHSIDTGDTHQKNNKLLLPCSIVLFIVIAFFLMQNNPFRKFYNGNSVINSKTAKLGDTITFGTYNDEKIQWRILKLSDNKKDAVLISKNILCMKAFDAAESGKYNFDKTGNDYYAETSEADNDQTLQIEVRGNSDWSVSNIRTWLNSSKEVVDYKDQAPAQTAMSELKNGYNNEPGFLHGFSKSEMDAIKEVENTTTGNKISGKKTIRTKDKVYLLSFDELKWFEEAGISVLAEPTKPAMDNDACKWYESLLEAYSVKEFYWWLREPAEEYSSKCRLVGNGYLKDNIYLQNVGLEGYGIRPAVTVDIDKLHIKS